MSNAGGDEVSVESERTAGVVAPRKRRLWPIGVGLLVLLGVAVGAVFAVKRLTPKRALPIVAQKLPTNTSVIVDGRSMSSGLDDLKVLPDIYVASTLSVLCGGVDVVERVTGARGRTIQELTDSGLMDLSSQREKLQCGEAIRKSLTTEGMTIVRFHDNDADRGVAIVRSKGVELPASLGFEKHSFSGLGGFCQTAKEASTKDDKEKKDSTDQKDAKPPGCNKDSLSVTHDNDTWAFGKFEDVEAFARSYTTTREEISTGVELLQQTIAEAEPADVTEVRAKPDKINWEIPCEMVARVGKHKEFVAACMPKGQEKLLDAITTRVRGAAVQRDIVAKAERVHVSYTLLARDTDAAKEMEKDLVDFVRDWRAQLDNGETEMSKLVHAKSDNVEDQFWASVYDPYLRALRAAHVERSGRAVKLVVNETLRPEEAKSMREFTASRTKDRAAAGDIAQAVLDGKPIPEKALATFVPAATAKWMLAPHATDKDCGDAQGHLGELLGTLKNVESVKDMLADWRKLCVGSVMPPEYRSCLVNAKDTKSFWRCRVPWSPQVVELEEKLAGAWKVEHVDGGYISRDDREFLDGLIVEFKDTRVATHIGPVVTAGSGELRSIRKGHGQVVLPFLKITPDVTLDLTDEGELKLTDLKDVHPSLTSLTLKRTKVETSLFVEAEKTSKRKTPEYDRCLSSCMSGGGAVADCDKQCLDAK